MKKLDLINKIKNQLSAIVKGEYAMIKAGELMLYTPDEEIQMGSEVFLMDAENNAVDLTDGEYSLDNGVVIKVEAGKVVSMSSMKEDVEMEEVIEEVIEDEKVELVVKMAELIDSKTGEEVSTTMAMDIAEEIIAKVLEVVEESADMEDFKEKAFGIKKEMQEEVIEEVVEEEKIKEVEAKFNAQIAALEAKIAELSAEPIEESIDKKKVEFRDVNDKGNVTLDIQSFREKIRKNR